MFNLKDPGMTMKEIEVGRRMEKDLKITNQTDIILMLFHNQKILEERINELKEYHNKLANDTHDKMIAIHEAMHSIVNLIELTKKMIK